MFSVLVIRLRSLRLLRVSGIVMRLRMFLLLITFLKASHSFRNRLLVICKNAYLFATMIMTSVSSPFSCCSGIVRLNLRSEERFSRNAETDLVCRLLLEKKNNIESGDLIDARVVVAQRVAAPVELREAIAERVHVGA